MPSHGVGLCSGIVEAPREALDAGKALDAPYHCARTDAGGALGRDALPARPRWPAAPGSSASSRRQQCRLRGGRNRAAAVAVGALREALAKIYHADRLVERPDFSDGLRSSA
jgi:hypothetical protein